MALTYQLGELGWLEFERRPRRVGTLADSVADRVEAPRTEDRRLVARVLRDLEPSV